MKHLKKFESFSVPVETNEGIGDIFSGKAAYKRTVEFLDGGSEEAKEIKNIYKEIKDSVQKGDKEFSDENKDRMKRITSIGAKWANANKMEAKDYAYSSIKTVLEEDYQRKFKGGPDLNIGESKRYRRK